MTTVFAPGLTVAVIDGPPGAVSVSGTGHVTVYAPGLDVDVLVPSPVPNATSTYRYQHKYLFQVAPYHYEPNRMTVGVSDATRYDRRGAAPMWQRVGSGWYWDKMGGDWIDAAGVRYGTNATLSVALNSGSETNYNVNCTAIVQQAQVGNRWLAMLWRSSGSSRTIYGKSLGSAYHPSINVIYTDNTSETLACRGTIRNSVGGSLDPSFEGTTNILPIFVEFERPSKPVASATLFFRVAVQSSGTANLQGFLLDPPVNKATTALGAAYSAPLDAGLVTHPDTLILHRYLDGVNVDDFRMDNNPGPVSNWTSFDPAIVHPGGYYAKDETKYPHVSYQNLNRNVCIGKWGSLPTTIRTSPVSMNAADPGDTIIVPSTHTDEGFEPLAPGMGALRFRMHRSLNPSGLPITDGSLVGESGTGFDKRIMLPDEAFGTLDDMYVRTYFRLGTPDGLPFQDDLSSRYQVHQSGSDAAPTEVCWIDKAGKWGMVPDHNTYAGGFSSTSGGVGGWQARLAWSIGDSNENGGPSEQVLTNNFHRFDYAMNPLGNYPRNYSFGTNGQVIPLGEGGMGTMKFHQWYCQEIRMKLNTVTNYYPGFKDDGIYQFWLDGRLVTTETGLVFRQRPVFRGLGNSRYNATLSSLNQFSEAVITGMADGEGYAGVTVRHKAGAPSNPYCFVAVVSRYSATHAVVGLFNRGTSSTTTGRVRHYAMTDPIPWADGDVLRLEAVGTAPTVLTVKQNGNPLTLKWYTGATDYPNPPSTALQTATSYSTTATGFDTNFGVGIHACNNNEGKGLHIRTWSGGVIGGESFSDNFATYTDGDLATKNPLWISHGAVSPLVVRAGRVIADPITRTSIGTVYPMRELGHKDIMICWFHGGQTLNTQDRVMFISGIVASKSYIGPMKLS